MSTLIFPDVRIASLEWYLVSNTQTFTSPLSGVTQTLELPGAKWRASIGIKDLEAADSRVMSAFLVKLRGQSGRFSITDFRHPTPAGAASGTPVVAGAGQTGNALLTSGWTPSTTGILLAGDYIQVGDELKMVVDDANSDATGAATLNIEPPLRNSPADASTIITDHPKCIMALENKQVGWPTRSPLLSSFTINCLEAL